jgi:Mg/Co/Ni transporter MgtE
MPLLTLESWKRFQALGKRSVLRRALVTGIIVGAVSGVTTGLVAASAATQGLPPRRFLMGGFIAACVTGALVVLTYLVIWELLRRKFSHR